MFFRTGGAQIAPRLSRPDALDGPRPAGAFGFSPTPRTGAAMDAAAGRPSRARTPAVALKDDDPASVLALYRRLIAGPRELLTATGGELVEEHHDLVTIRRGDVVVRRATWAANRCRASRRPSSTPC